MAKTKASPGYKRKTGGGAGKVAERYVHPEQTSPMRPDVGTQAQFRKKKPPKTYRYDSSLSPALEWDGQHASRELGEWLIAQIVSASALPAPHEFPAPQEFRGSDRVVASVRGLRDAADQLKRLAKPFLDWAVHMIVETKGFDELADVKKAAAERWVAAVNADRQFGEWRYVMARSVGQVRQALERVSGSGLRGDRAESLKPEA